MTRCHIFAVLSEERAVVDAEGHGHRRFVDSDWLERFGILCVTDGIAYLKALDTDHRADVAVLDDIGLHVSHTGESVQLFDFGLDHRTIFLGQCHGLSVFELSAVYAADSNTAHITVVVETGDQHLRRARILFRRRDVLDDSVHQVREVSRRLAPVGRNPALLGTTVQRLEIKLVVRGIEVAHQVEYLFLHLVRTAVQLVYFVDNYDGFEAQLQCFLQHKSRLRHCAFESIDEQQHAIRHIQHAFNLTAEVCVPRSVDDIDFRAFVIDGHILGQNSNTTFALQVVVVQDEFAFVLVLAEQVSCVQHLIHQRCFAVVHMRDDGYISDILHKLTCGAFYAKIKSAAKLLQKNDICKHMPSF